MSLCKDCIQGVSYEGTPAGKIQTIGDVECYVATPTVHYPKDKVILFLTDAFGLPLPNSQLLADDFARNGFKTVLPDYLHGDPVPRDCMEPGSTFDLAKWLSVHGTADTRPLLDSVIAALKDEGVTSFAAVGYCFGGRYVLDLAFDNVIVVGATAHPSLFQVPADPQKYITSSKAPLLINSCADEQFTPEAQAETDEIFNSNGGFAPGYKRNYFEGCGHGFAVRGDLSDPRIKAGKEGAFKATVEWFIKYM
ncbi:Alpha/Beta hydrolase protein [Mycena galopus ATCC 62051]|nr:Alpha/Beta hydrolase protein [Mycena galopus ATCC 62051]